MKKIFILLFAMLPAFCFAGCDKNDDPGTEINPDNNDDNDNEDDNGSVTPGTGKILIAYFSRWGNTDYPSDVDASTGASIIINNEVRKGTNQVIAEYIQEAVGGDIHLIETTEPYPVDFDAVRDLNHTEQSAGTMRALKNRIENIDQYETVFIGYPSWASTIPRPIATFITENDLSGKKVVPFCTHDGYGAGNGYSVIRNLASESEVLEGLSIQATNVLSSKDQIQEWLTKLGIEQDETQTASIRVTAGETTITGIWLDTPLANEIRTLFPFRVRMGRYGNREFYGSMPSRPQNTGEGQRTFENGDITYCPQNNTIAIFYAQTDRPNLGMDVIPIGKVTSSLSVFDTMEGSIDMAFEATRH